jgi:hypothetical protein
MLGSIAARVFVTLTCLAVFANALKFNMAAVPYVAGKKKCFTQWVPQNTLVMLNINASPGAHMRVDVEVGLIFHRLISLLFRLAVLLQYMLLLVLILLSVLNE